MAKSGYFVEQGQRRLLVKYWDFYTALDHGTRQPTTDAQLRFVDVCRGKRHPHTDHERAYLAGKKLIAPSVLSEKAVVRNGFELSPRQMVNEPIRVRYRNMMPRDYHEVDVDRFASTRRTVRRHNW